MGKFLKFKFYLCIGTETLFCLFCKSNSTGNSHEVPQDAVWRPLLYNIQSEERFFKFDFVSKNQHLLLLLVRYVANNIKKPHFSMNSRLTFYRSFWSFQAELLKEAFQYRAHSLMLDYFVLVTNDPLAKNQRPLFAPFPDCTRRAFFHNGRFHLRLVFFRCIKRALCRRDPGYFTKRKASKDFPLARQSMANTGWILLLNCRSILLHGFAIRTSGVAAHFCIKPVLQALQGIPWVLNFDLFLGETTSPARIISFVANSNR